MANRTQGNAAQTPAPAPRTLAPRSQMPATHGAACLIRSQTKLACLVVAASVAPTAFAQQTIDPQRSTITIHVLKSGLLSIAGHEHWVNAPIAEGVVSSTGRPYVQFSVDAAKMQVRAEPGVDAATQAEIQKDMQEITLESSTYPEIRFRSSAVERQRDGRWKVEGQLTLRGVTRPLTVVVEQVGAVYTGRATIRQTDFGIKPISVGGGMIKVRNELEIDFRIVCQPE